MKKRLPFGEYFWSACRSLLALLIVMNPVSAQQPEPLMAGLPFTARVVPIASEMHIDRLQFEIFAIRIDGSINAIAEHYVNANNVSGLASQLWPHRIQRSGDELFVSGWRESGLVTLKLRGNPSSLDTAVSVGLLIVSKTAPASTARRLSPQDSTAFAESLVPAEARLLRTVTSRDGDVEHVLILARISNSSSTVARIVADHFMRKGFVRPALPSVQTESRQLLHFQKQRLQVSVGVHSQGDDALVLIQASATRHSRLAHPLRKGKS